MGMPVAPAPPADPYNCADGFANWVDGPWARRSGAAGCTERAALGRPPPVALLPELPPLPTTAMPASPTGWRDGAHQRRIGAATTPARVAHQQLEVALESPVRLGERCTRGALALARHLPAILSTCFCSQPSSRLGVRTLRS